VEIHKLFGLIAGLLSIVAFIPYIIAIIRKRAKPNRATWIIWSVMSFVIAISYYASGARETIWVAVAYAIGSTITAILSIKFGEGGWTKFDRFCLVGSALSILLWLITKQPMVALIINIIIDLLGALPTMKKSYLNPSGEDKLTWTLFELANIINLFAITSLKFSIMIFPVYMFSCCGIITILVVLPRRREQNGRNAG
jgi:hypothetical protein